MTDPAPQQQVEIQLGVPYCTHDGTELSGDLYRPKGKGPFPVLIGAPGGGWRVCARSSLSQWGSYLAERGIGFFAIDYRVATATRKAFPEAVQDVLSAIRFIRASAADMGVDPDRIGLLGTSAGAHLCALAALAAGSSALGRGYPEDALAEVSPAVKVLVAIYGIFDLRKQWQDDLVLNPGVEGNLARNLVGNDPFEDPQLYFDASPLSHVTYEKNRMPVFVSWGTADEFVLPAQSEAFVRTLQQARFNVRTHQAVGASHFWAAQPLDEATSDSAHLAPRLTAFLRMTL